MNNNKCIEVKGMFFLNGSHVIPCGHCNGVGIRYGESLKDSHWCSNCEGKGVKLAKKEII